MLRPTSTFAGSFLLLAALSGCYESYGLSGGGLVDASLPDAHAADGSAPDAGPAGGRYWRLETRGARLSFLNGLGCTAFAGGTLVATVTVPLASDCEHAGPVEVTASDGGRYLISAQVWVEIRPDGDPTPCIASTESETRHVVLDALEGETRVSDSTSGSEAVVVVAPAPVGITCVAAGAPDAMCRVDCDCQAGLRCIPELGDAVACFGGRCGAPCDVAGGPRVAVYDADLACPVDQSCVDQGLAGSTCGLRASACTVGACSDGLECFPTPGVGSRCDWTLSLSDVVRHACMQERDCVAGTHCVEHADGARRCEVPCLSNTMECPSMHACQGSASGWVCEWLGE